MVVWVNGELKEHEPESDTSLEFVRCSITYSALVYSLALLSLSLSLSPLTLPFSNDFTSVMVSASLPCHAGAHEWITRISRS